MPGLAQFHPAPVNDPTDGHYLVWRIGDDEQTVPTGICDVHIQLVWSARREGRQHPRWER